MMPRMAIHVIGLLLVLALAGCATANGASSVGSDAWYEQRVAEIEASHENGDINKEEYLRLKGETDAIRADYEADRRYRRPSFSFGLGVIAH